MIIDCHIHTVATAHGEGFVSPYLLKSPGFRTLMRTLGVSDIAGKVGAVADREIERALMATINQARWLDAAVVLALDAVHRRGGERDVANTHLWVSNDHVMRLAAGHPRVLFGCSVHPYRTDALAELERCVSGGAVLMKWLPITQDFSPADRRCYPLYEAMAHHKLPLLCHTGFEHSLPMLSPLYADPRLLEPALRMGVTVIAAHCGTRDVPVVETDHVPTFIRMTREFERLYGDTAAMNQTQRSYAYRPLLRDPIARARLVHGSDWPLPIMPPVTQLGPRRSLSTLAYRNTLDRDMLIKQMLGLEQDYWTRAATLLRLPSRALVGSTAAAPHLVA